MPEEPRDAWRVDLPISPSPRVAAWIMAVAASASCALALAEGLSPAVAILAAAPLVALAVRAIRRDAFREGSGAATRLVAARDGRVEVTAATGKVIAGRLAGPHFVAPWLTVVGWVPDGRRWPRALLVAPDAVPPGEFRRLRILLRWAGR